MSQLPKRSLVQCTCCMIIEKIFLHLILKDSNESFNQDHCDDKDLQQAWSNKDRN